MARATARATAMERAAAKTRLRIKHKRLGAESNSPALALESVGAKRKDVGAEQQQQKAAAEHKVGTLESSLSQEANGDEPRALRRSGRSADKPVASTGGAVKLEELDSGQSTESGRECGNEQKRVKLTCKSLERVQQGLGSQRHTRGPKQNDLRSQKHDFGSGQLVLSSEQHGLNDQRDASGTDQRLSIEQKCLVSKQDATDANHALATANEKEANDTGPCLMLEHKQLEHKQLDECKGEGQGRKLAVFNDEACTSIKGTEQQDETLALTDDLELVQARAR
eukprot:6212358-Pleurochrysis_carterae.AAC.4